MRAFDLSDLNIELKTPFKNTLEFIKKDFDWDISDERMKIILQLKKEKWNIDFFKSDDLKKYNIDNKLLYVEDELVFVLNSTTSKYNTYYVCLSGIYNFKESGEIDFLRWDSLTKYDLKIVDKDLLLVDNYRIEIEKENLNYLFNFLRDLRADLIKNSNIEEFKRLPVKKLKDIQLKKKKKTIKGNRVSLLKRLFGPYMPFFSKSVSWFCFGIFIILTDPLLTYVFRHFGILEEKVQMVRYINLIFTWFILPNIYFVSNTYRKKYINKALRKGYMPISGCDYDSILAMNK